jgi:hypothetical protein
MTTWGWLVHEFTMDYIVAGGQGLLELGLAATPGHGNLLR